MFFDLCKAVFSMWTFWKVQNNKTPLVSCHQENKKSGAQQKLGGGFIHTFYFHPENSGRRWFPIWRSCIFLTRWGWSLVQPPTSRKGPLSFHWQDPYIETTSRWCGDRRSSASDGVKEATFSVGRWWREPGIHFLFDFGWSSASLFGSVGFAMLLLSIMRETWTTDDESDGTHLLLHHCGYDDDNPHPDDISTCHRNTYDIRLNIIIGLYCQRPKAVHTSTQHLPTYTWQSITKKNRNMSCNISLPLFTSTDKLSSLSVS